MASFLTSLWESIFTPGPTPTLLIATNATFGALQVLLLVLLVTTQSIHFIILSILCGGLWYAINWFAAEVQAAKAKDTEEQAQGKDKKDKDKERRRRTSPEPGSDTETEEPRSTGTATAGKAERRKAPPKPVSAPAADVPSTSSSQEASAKAGASPQLLKPDMSDSSGKGMGDSDLLHRRRSLGDSSGYVSTDSEWEKVSEEEGKK